MDCPCKAGRFGSFGLVVSVYWAMQCGGFAAMQSLVGAGTSLGIWWALWTGLSAILLVQGIIEARQHDDNINSGSVLLSVGLLALSFWAIAHHWFFSPDDNWIARASFIFWPSLMASEVFNLWLNFRGRRHAAVIQERHSSSGSVAFFRRRRRVRVEWISDNEPDYQFAPPHIAGVVEHDGDAPQIVYVKEGDSFIPVRLPVGVRRLR
jgi:hypothetical protein